MVSAHETNCALNPALSSDVSTNMHVDSSTHSPDSPDTPMHTLEIINLRDNLRTSDFEQFEKAGTQTPPRKVVAHHVPTPRCFAVSRPRSFAMSSPRSFEVPGLEMLGMKTSPRDGTGRKPATQVCELCRKLMPPLTTEATTVHEQVEAGVGEPCANTIKSSAVCARTGLIRLHLSLGTGLSFERSPTTGWYYVISIVSESPAESCCSIQLMVSLPHPYASIRCYCYHRHQA
jgi:hypothetical protein